MKRAPEPVVGALVFTPAFGDLPAATRAIEEIERRNGRYNVRVGSAWYVWDYLWLEQPEQRRLRDESRRNAVKSRTDWKAVAIMLGVVALVLAAIVAPIVGIVKSSRAHGATSSSPTGSTYDSSSGSKSSSGGYGTAVPGDPAYDTNGNGRLDYKKNADGTPTDYTSDPSRQDEVDRQTEDFLRSRGINPDAPVNDPSQW